MSPILVLALTSLVLVVSFLRIVTGQNTYNESDIEQLTRLMDKVNMTANATNLIEERGLCDAFLSLIGIDAPCAAVTDVTKCIVEYNWPLNTGGKGCAKKADMGKLQNFDTSNSANLCDTRVKEIIDCIYDKCRSVMGERYAAAIKQIKDVGCAHLDVVQQMDACKNSHLNELRQACGDSLRGNGEPNLGDIKKQIEKIDGLCV
ncbi:hypothetical protein Ddc_13020 [Ditylenchus destructor]|nr:hypothetical protein Ddc_13020 [Ditylenchus destructor]